MIKKISKWDVPTWLQGLIAAFLSGGFGAVATGAGAALVDPKDFHFGGIPSLKVMGMSFVLQGGIGVALFLKQSPLPPRITVEMEVDTGTGLEKDAAVVVSQTTIHVPKEPS